MGKVALLVAAALCTAACARPPEERIAALKRRGISSDELNSALRAEEAKFALFRSYRRVDEIVGALEAGRTPPPTPTMDGLTSAWKCQEQGNIVCYCVNQGISCVERSR